MGTYYRYVNYTRQEFVSLSGLRAGGDKENAVLYCAPALLYLIAHRHALGDGYRGRWAPVDQRPERPGRPPGGVAASRSTSDDVRVVSDAVYDFCDMDEEFLNITPGVLQSMRAQLPAFVEDYQPRIHDVTLVQRVMVPVFRYELAECVSATCKCGWRTGPFRGEGRETILEHAVGAHVNG